MNELIVFNKELQNVDFKNILNDGYFSSLLEKVAGLSFEEASVLDLKKIEVQLKDLTDALTPKDVVEMRERVAQIIEIFRSSRLQAERKKKTEAEQLKKDALDAVLSEIKEEDYPLLSKQDILKICQEVVAYAVKGKRTADAKLLNLNESFFILKERLHLLSIKKENEFELAKRAEEEREIKKEACSLQEKNAIKEYKLYISLEPKHLGVSSIDIEIKVKAISKEKADIVFKDFNKRVER